MPTPQGPRDPRAYDGVVSGLNWNDFTSRFAQTNSLRPNEASSFAHFDGIGDVAGRRAESAQTQFGHGEMGSNFDSMTNGPTYGGYQDYVLGLGDGTQNSYTMGPNGEVMSTNSTVNDDSWWDSTGLILAASLGFGGATAALSSAGIGVAGAGAGAANVGAGYAASGGLEGALGAGGYGAAGNVAQNIAQAGSTDIGSASYNPWNPSNWTAEAGTVANDGTVAGAGAGAAASGNSVGGLAALDSAAVGAEGAVPGLTEGFGAAPWYSQPSTQNLLQQLGGKSGSNPVSSIANILSGKGSGADFSSLLGSAASIYSGVAGSNAASKAADQQSNAFNQANALTAAIYGDSVNRNQPFLNAGVGALGQQTNLLGLNGADAQQAAYGQFKASPDYQWRFDQGMKAAGNGAAASGLLGSGRYLKDLTNYGQGAASQEYGNYSNRLSNLINVGQNSANLTGQLGANYGNTAAGLTASGGIAQSAGTIGSSNAWSNALTQLLKQSNGYYGAT